MTEKEKMLNGELYAPLDAELHAMHLYARKLFTKYNKIGVNNEAKKDKYIKKLFGKTGVKIDVEQPFYCDYGCNIEVGEGFFANYGCIILDVNKVKIGRNCFLAPNVGIYTATHPVKAEERYNGVELGFPITIGNDCWLGAGAIICPGVTLGDRVVVGAGSVVTKSFGSDVVIAGNPAKIIRNLSTEGQL